VENRLAHQINNPLQRLMNVAYFAVEDKSKWKRENWDWSSLQA
jgi:hypothetical protein